MTAFTPITPDDVQQLRAMVGDGAVIDDPKQLQQSAPLHRTASRRKARFGDSVLTHIEFMRFRGELAPQGLSLVRFATKAQLWEIIKWCESNGF